MENQPNTENSDKPIEKPAQITEIQTQQQNNIPSPKKASKTKALLLIFIPLIFWAISFGLLILDVNKSPAIAPSADPYAVIEVKQNSILPIMNIVNFLLGPVLLGMLIYGLVLLIKKPTQSLNGTLNTTHPTKMPNYKSASVTLLVGSVLLLVAFLIVHNIRSGVGYSGSEAEIGSFPFIFSGVITIVVSIIMYISTMVRRITFKREGRDLKSTTKRGIITGIIIVFFIVPIISLIVQIRVKSRPMLKDEVIKLINNCEVYNVNREIGNKVIVNYKDKDINHHRTNGADAKYFDEYVEAAKNNTTCEVQIHDRPNETTPY
ncbi:MAG: hypothetical protein WCO19_01335 [Candidatus Saccharibacteria bacterium]